MTVDRCANCGQFDLKNVWTDGMKVKIPEGIDVNSPPYMESLNRLKNAVGHEIAHPEKIIYGSVGGFQDASKHENVYIMRIFNKNGDLVGVKQEIHDDGGKTIKYEDFFVPKNGMVAQSYENNGLKVESGVDVEKNAIHSKVTYNYNVDPEAAKLHFGGNPRDITADHKAIESVEYVFLFRLR